MPDPSVGSGSDRDLPGASETVDLVRGWIDRSSRAPHNRVRRRRRIAAEDPAGGDVLVRFADHVVRPTDLRVAARGLERLSRDLPDSLPRWLRVGLALSGGLALLLPWPVIPIARHLFRRTTAHLILEAAPARLERSLAGLRRPGIRVDLVPLGDPVLGERSAEQQFAALRDLRRRPDVDRITVRVGSLTGPSSGWDHEAAVARATDRMARLLAETVRSRPGALLTLAPESSRELEAALAVGTRVLAGARFARVEAGIALPVVLPDALEVLDEITTWARRRVAAGGVGVTVRIDAGAPLARERADSTVRGRVPAAWPTRTEADAAYLRMLDRALTPGRTDAVRVVVASPDLVDLAFARLLAVRRGVTSRLTLQFPHGVAPELVDVLRADVGEVILSAAVAPADEYAAAVGELLAREADPDTGALPLAASGNRSATLERRAARLREALTAAGEGVAVPDRRANRLARELPEVAVPFRSEPDTDPSLAANREWAGAILARAGARATGPSEPPPATAVVRDAAELRERVAAAAAAGRAWRLVAPAERTVVLHRAGQVLAVLRGRLIEAIVAGSTAGFAEADAEVSGIVDAAHYAAERIADLAAVEGAAFEPGALAAVVDGRRDSIADLIGGVLAVIAAGSAVIVAPQPHAVRVAAAVADALREAGLPRGVVDVVSLADDDTRRALLLAAELDRAIVTGSREAAEFVRSRRPELPIHGEVGGRTVSVVTPSADLDLAAADLVEGAVRARARGGRGRPLAILVGTAAESAGLRARLADSVTRRDLEGAADVVLDIASAPTLDEAIRVQSEVGGGSAVLYALDPDEIAGWLARVEASDLFVNRAPTTGPAGLRPAGGGVAALGPRLKAGGPNSLIALGSWRPVVEAPDGDLRLDGLDDSVRSMIEACQGALDFPGYDRVRRGALSDEAAWRTEFGRPHDPGALGVERTVLRYRPTEVSVRLAEAGAFGDLFRVLAAGVRARAPLRVSSAVPLPPGLLRLASDGTLRITDAVLESDAQWEERVVRERPPRIRLVGASIDAVARVVADSLGVAVWAGPVTTAGRIELLPFLREQTVTITAHRFGILDREIAALPI